MSEEETIKSFKSLMYNAKANWDYFSYEILFNFFSLYNNAIEENKKLKNTDLKQAKIEYLEVLNEKLQKENKELKEYIAIAPNLDEMTAVKYRNIREDAYIQGRAEEQQRAEQIIYENYIPIQEIKDKIEELNRKIDKSIDNSKGGLDEEFIEKAGELLTQKRILQELLEETEK